MKMIIHFASETIIYYNTLPKIPRITWCYPKVGAAGSIAVGKILLLGDNFSFLHLKIPQQFCGKVTK
jgi:hypothetical protein